MWNRSSLFAEALVLPYNLNFPEKSGSIQSTDIVQDMLDANSGCIYHEKEHKEAKKFVHVLSRITPTSSASNLRAPERKFCHNPCSFSFRSASLHGTLMPARVHRSNGSCFKDSVDGQHNMKILLEFKADSFIYYQVGLGTLYCQLYCYYVVM